MPGINTTKGAAVYGPVIYWPGCEPWCTKDPPLIWVPLPLPENRSHPKFLDALPWLETKNDFFRQGTVHGSNLCHLSYLDRLHCSQLEEHVIRPHDALQVIHQQVYICTFSSVTIFSISQLLQKSSFFYYNKMTQSSIPFFLLIHLSATCFI